MVLQDTWRNAGVNENIVGMTYTDQIRNTNTKKLFVYCTILVGEKL